MQKKAGNKQNVANGEGAGVEESSVTDSNRPDPWQTPLCKLPVTLAYAAVIDVRNAECEITDQMVAQACQDIEMMQQFPFAPRKSAQAR